MTNRQWWFVGLMVATLYAVAPLVLFGYTWPQNDDPMRLQAQLDAGLGVWAYYGHLPALLIGMAAYYWLTPVIVYCGLWFTFSRYGWQTPLLLWGALFLVARPVLFDMWAGTFIQQVGFYGLGLPLLRLGNKNPGWLTLAPLLIVFHTYSGVLVCGMAVVMLAYQRRWYQLAWLTGLASTVAGLSWTYLGSSARHLGRLATATKLAESYTFMEWLGSYVGVGTWLLLAFGIFMLWRAWRRGWRPVNDSMFMGLMVALLPLGFLTFIFTTNPDRPGKMLVEILILLIGGQAISAMKILSNGWFWFIVSFILTVIVIFTVPETLLYWIGMGAYK